MEKNQGKFKKSFEYFCKYYGKWSICSIGANTPFSMIFSNMLYFKGIKGVRGYKDVNICTYSIFLVHFQHGFRLLLPQPGWSREPYIPPVTVPTAAGTQSDCCHAFLW